MVSRGLIRLLEFRNKTKLKEETISIEKDMCVFEDGFVRRVRIWMSVKLMECSEKEKDFGIRHIFNPILLPIGCDVTFPSLNFLIYTIRLVK